MDYLEGALIRLAGFIPGKGGEGILTSGEYGEVLGLSQQSASRYLKILEQKGYIKRSFRGRRQAITLSNKGIGVLEQSYSDLQRFFAGTEGTVSGIVTTGVGEGAYYVKNYSPKFRKSLGYKPYPGTLNLIPETPVNLSVYEHKRIPGFSKSHRSFGDIDVYKAVLSKEGQKVECHLAVPHRRHKRNQLEFISQHNLREKLSIDDGDNLEFLIQ